METNKRLIDKPAIVSFNTEYRKPFNGESNKVGKSEIESPMFQS